MALFYYQTPASSFTIPFNPFVERYSRPHYTLFDELAEIQRRRESEYYEIERRRRAQLLAEQQRRAQLIQYYNKLHALKQQQQQQAEEQARARQFRARSALNSFRIPIQWVIEEQQNQPRINTNNHNTQPQLTNSLAQLAAIADAADNSTVKPANTNANTNTRAAANTDSSPKSAPTIKFELKPQPATVTERRAASYPAQFNSHPKAKVESFNIPIQFNQTPAAENNNNTNTNNKNNTNHVVCELKSEPADQTQSSASPISPPSGSASPVLDRQVPGQSDLLVESDVSESGDSTHSSDLDDDDDDRVDEEIEIPSKTESRRNSTDSNAAQQ